MTTKVRKWFLMAFGIIALSGLAFYPVSNTYAKGLDDNKSDDNISGRKGGDDDDRGPQEVKSSKLKCKKGKCKCKTQNNFRTSDDVHAKGEHFPPLSTVDVYVTPNREWRTREPIGGDVGDGVDMVTTDIEGKFCAKIWGNPLPRGLFDIVVDNNMDGTFDPADGDTVDGRSRNVGFRVR